MTKEEFEAYLLSIGGLTRTYKEHKGPIVEAGWFGVGEGWYGIIKDMIAELVEFGWDKRVSQVKEKFGGLRFYIENTPEGANGILIKYEALSYSICETCSEAGSLRKGGWMKTLCDEHADGKEPFEKKSL